MSYQRIRTSSSQPYFRVLVRFMYLLPEYHIFIDIHGGLLNLSVFLEGEDLVRHYLWIHSSKIFTESLSLLFTLVDILSRLFQQSLFVLKRNVNLFAVSFLVSTIFLSIFEYFTSYCLCFIQILGLILYSSVSVYPDDLVVCICKSSGVIWCLFLYIEAISLAAYALKSGARVSPMNFWALLISPYLLVIVRRQIIITKLITFWVIL